jgi:hypothetical protein
MLAYEVQRVSDGDDTKTREQLLAEIDALKAELARRERDPGQRALDPSSAPVFSVPITRRESLVSWVAPVILSLPVMQGAGLVFGTGTARAAAVPTIAGRCIVSPTATPSASPTAPPTARPTFTPTTTKPKANPTLKPTVTPTVAPTLGMAAAPDSRPSLVGLIPLGSARTMCRARIAA